MKERLDKLIDLMKTTENYYMLHELTSLSLEIEIAILEAEVNVIETDIAILNGNKLITEIRKEL